MTREETIKSLVRLAHPLDALRASPSAFEWDWEEPPLARLGGLEVASVLQRYVAAAEPATRWRLGQICWKAATTWSFSQKPLMPFSTWLTLSFKGR